MNSTKTIHSVIVCIGTILISSLIMSCGCTDCGPAPTTKEPYFVNATDGDVTVTVDIPAFDGKYYTVVESKIFKTIQSGDTLVRKRYYENDGDFFINVDAECGLVVEDCASPTVSLEFRFLGDPEQCISFTGPVIDSINDPRSWNAYEDGGDINNYDIFMRGIKYIFKITEAMKDTASLCE
jgi:hypothetical protein